MKDEKKLVKTEELTLCIFCSRLPRSPVPLLQHKKPIQDVVGYCPACGRRVVTVHGKLWFEFTPVKKKERHTTLR